MRRRLFLRGLLNFARGYIECFEEVVRKIQCFLKPGGVLVFSVEHPVFTAQGSQDWHYNEQGEPMHFPIDNYYFEGKRIAHFLGEDVVKYHRTLTTYLNSLLNSGLQINNIVEPQPAAHLLDSVPGMRDELRRPMMLIVVARKPH